MSPEAGNRLLGTQNESGRTELFPNQPKALVRGRATLINTKLGDLCRASLGVTESHCGVLSRAGNQRSVLEFPARMRPPRIGDQFLNERLAIGW